MPNLSYCTLITTGTLEEEKPSCRHSPWLSAPQLWQKGTPMVEWLKQNRLRLSPPITEILWPVVGDLIWAPHSGS